MRTITSPRAMQRLAERWRLAGDRVGVVPTMGALHEGHVRLIRTARRECDRVILTLFVNPAQFGAGEDLEQYPRTPAADKRIARANGVDAVFEPSVEDVYPAGFCTTVHVAGLTEQWEGAARATHFDGVTTVVSKLFNMTKPHRAYFGQKDGQQAAVVQRLAADLNFDVKVRVCPTVREADGLALSSRNTYLTRSQRDEATCLHEALRAARAMARTGERRTARLKQTMRRVIARRPLARLDYASVVARDTMREIPQLDGRPALAVVAVRIGDVRLIDNMVVKSPA